MLRLSFCSIRFGVGSTTLMSYCSDESHMQRKAPTRTYEARFLLSVMWSIHLMWTQSCITREVNSEMWIPKRFIIIFLLYLGNGFVILLQGNLSIAIVDMTSNKTGIRVKPEYEWKPHQIGLILSSFNYGYVLSTICGLLFRKFGGAMTYGISITLMAFLSVISPLVLPRSLTAFVVVQGLEGFCSGLAYLSSYDVWKDWVPLKETMKLFSFSLLGYNTGAIITCPLCGFLIHKLGWPSAFYVPGGAGLVWSIIWFIFVSSNPETDKRNGLKRSVKSFLIFKARLTDVPLLKIISSKVVLAIAIAKFAYGFGYLGFRIILPLFVNDNTNSNVEIVGYLSGIPNIIAFFFVPFAGIILDYIQNKKIYSVTVIQKTFLVCTCLIIGLALISIVFLQNFIYSICMIGLFTIIFSFPRLILSTICFYITSEYSSAVAGITQFCSAFGEMLAPVFVGFVVQHHLHSEWSIYFTTCGGTFLVVSIIFLLYGSSEVQPWNQDSINEHEIPEITKFETIRSAID
ncbi:hypothetical protein PGB90_009025 [Kerria lacca]